MQGRVKFHRKITERERYSDANTFRVFFHLITIANHKDWKRQWIEVKRWQTITGRIELAKQLNLSEMQIRTSLDKLERTGEISKKVTSRYSIITVVKYCDYNDYDLEDNQQITNKQPTDNQQLTTNKNDKKKKEWKEVIDFTPPTLLDVERYLSSKWYNKTLAAKFFDYFEEAKRHIKWWKKMENWRKAVSGRYDDRYIIKYTRDELIKIAEWLMKAKQDWWPEAVVKYKEEWGVELCKKAVIEYNTKPKNQR